MWALALVTLGVGQGGPPGGLVLVMPDGQYQPPISLCEYALELYDLLQLMLTALQYDCTVITQEVEQCNSDWAVCGPFGHTYGSGEEECPLAVGEVPPPPLEKCLAWYVNM